MKNYVIADIENPNKPYPDYKNKKFKSLQEYLEIAKKSIMYYAPKGNIAKILRNSDDAISMIAYKIMLADWRHEQEKGCNENTWRYKAGQYAVKDFLESQRKLKNRNSVPFKSDDAGDYYEIEDMKQESPTKKIKEEERIGRIRNRLQFAMENAKLSDVQKRCLQIRFFEKEEDGEPIPYAKIGKMIDPQITRQAVEQNIKRGLAKLKFVLQSEKS